MTDAENPTARASLSIEEVEANVQRNLARRESRERFSAITYPVAVVIARALANGPSVLLMDEPFGALDAQTRETMQEELLRIWQQDRKTVVFVTHSISEAIFLGDRIVVMATRTGSVKAVIAVPLAHPRERSTPEFVALERQIKQLVREEVEKLGVI